MAIKFDKVQAGDLLYDCHKYRMGNTTMRRMGTWQVQIIEIKENGAIVSWNGNSPKFWPKYRVERLRRKPIPERPPAHSVFPLLTDEDIENDPDFD